MSDAIRIGLLGCGTVGSSVVRILNNHAEEIALRADARIEIARVAVRDPSKRRDVDLDDDVLTADPFEVVRDPQVQVVVETIGGLDPAKDLLVEALRSGKHVVTANKELLSSAGRELMDAAEHAGVDLLFEGAVAGGIPIIRPMKESLAGDRVRRVMGILNGTTNFILTRMSETGSSFEDALDEAQRSGYAEADPAADIDGGDAAAKLSILASIAFNTRVVANDVAREGIAEVRAADIAAAHELGYEVKLVAVAEEVDGEISLHVHPAMLPRTHPLAAVRDVFNAVFVEGDQTGELMFLGRGAGGGPTGAAVVGDIVDIARHIAGGGRPASGLRFHDRARLKPMHEARARYYVVLSVLDQPGVLAKVAGAFAANEVSIASVRQEGRGDEATLVLITHAASVGRHAATFRGLEDIDAVKAVESRMRVLGTDEV